MAVLDYAETMPSSLRPMRDSSLRARAAPEQVTIDDWAIRDRPLSSSLALTLAVGAGWIAGWATEAPWAGVAVATVLVVVAWRTWLPVRYELGSSGVTQSVLGWRRRIPWAAIVQHEVRGSGVLLMPDAMKTPLSPLRGLFLHWHDQRDQVLAQLDYYRQS